MSSAAIKTYLTPQQYLAIERKALDKSEYYRGEMFPRPRASRKHNLIKSNMTRNLGNQLAARPCEVYTSDMRVLVDEAGLVAYPDLVVVCDEPRFLDDEFDTLLNPTVLFEILSPSTQRYDQVEKAGHYRRLTSLREYVFVAQDRLAVERYTRQGQDWRLTDFGGEEDILRLDSIDCEVALREIYRKVEFPRRPPRP